MKDFISVNSEKRNQVHINELITKGMNQNIPSVLGASNTNSNLNLMAKEDRSTFYNRYFEKYRKISNVNDIINLFSIRINIFRAKAYLEGISIIKQLRKQRESFSNDISLIYLVETIQERILSLNNNSNSENKRLNLMDYIKTKQEYETLKQKIALQVKTQIKFWKIYSENEPNMNQMFLLSKEVDAQRKVVEQLWNSFETKINKKFMQPLLLYGFYLDLVNNKPLQSNSFFKTKMNIVLQANEVEFKDQYDLYR
jgi:hypothetical protein